MKFNRFSTFVHSCRVVFELNVKHKVIKTILYNSLFSVNFFLCHCNMRSIWKYFKCPWSWFTCQISFKVMFGSLNLISTRVSPRFVWPLFSLFSILVGSRVPNTSFLMSVPQSSRSRCESLWGWVEAGNSTGVWKIHRIHENFSTMMRKMGWI